MSFIRLSSITKEKLENSANLTKQHSMEEETKDTELFTKRMRRETRDVHKISDALVNAKMAFGKS